MPLSEYKLWYVYHQIHDLSPRREETLTAILADIAARVGGSKTSRLENYMPSIQRERRASPSNTSEIVSVLDAAATSTKQ